MGTEVAIALGLLVALTAAMEVGYFLGRRKMSTGEPPGGGTLGSIQGALLGLLGLLLGFSFAGAASRFLERQELIVQEANAIGTAYLRADLLHAPHSAQLRTALARYRDQRLRVSKTLRGGLTEQDAAMVITLQEHIWNAARDGTLARPEMAEIVIPPVNDVIDLHTTRLAAARKHLPLPVMSLLIGCSVLSIGVIGFGCGLAGQRSRMMTGALVLLISATLWITVDLDHPRAGLLRLNDAPLSELKMESTDLQ